MSSAGSGEKALVTGATGLLGSHLAERLTAQGFRVRALVRGGSRTDFLETLGVEIVRGDLTDTPPVRPPSPVKLSSFTASQGR